MKTRILNIFTLLVSISGLYSCIEYDMAKPRTLAEFTDFQVENASNVTISRDDRTVHIDLTEAADLSQVKVTSFTLNKNSRFSGAGLPEVLDLTQPFKITLAMYYDFEWTITASQKVNRYVKCVNQVGDAFFDVDRREAFVYVSKSQRLKNLTINDMKLELDGSQVFSTTGMVSSPEGVEAETVPCAFPMVLDCTVKRTFLVKTREGQVEWSLTAIPKDVPAQITSVAAWCWSADVKAMFDGASEVPAIMYKAKSAADWLTVPSDKVTVDGVNVSATIGELTEATDYDVKLTIGGKDVSQQSFTTDTPSQIPNLNFDDWWLSGKVWYPYAEGAPDSEKYWDSANPGAAGFIGSSTYPETEDVVKGKAAKMESKYAAIAFAAGNLYIGKFGKVEGIGAILDWGAEFTSMPAAMKGYFKYMPKAIDKSKPPYDNMIGKTDKCQIQIFLTDWDAPFVINTTAAQFVDIANDPHIIAFGRLETDETVTEYREFTIPLEYRSYRKPKYVVVSCCASSLGDYFTGGVGSTLMVDEFELIYK